MDVQSLENKAQSAIAGQVKDNTGAVLPGATVEAASPALIEGVRTVERQLLDVARSFRASQRRIFTSLVIPGTLPFIVSGMRIAIGRVLAGVIIAEFYAQTQGVGVMIYKASNQFLQGGSDRMMFGILLFTLLGIVLYEAVGYAERYFQRWRPSLDLEETT